MQKLKMHIHNIDINAIPFRQRSKERRNDAAAPFSINPMMRKSYSLAS